MTYPVDVERSFNSTGGNVVPNRTTRGTRPLLTDDPSARAMNAALAILDPFFELRATMPAQYIKAFLLVAREEGLSVSEYAERAGVSLSVMSRHLLDIGDRNRHMEKGFGLITYRPNPMELRKHEVFLTPEGKALRHKIMRQLGAI